MKPLLYTFGANSQTYEMAKGYIFHVSYGAPFIIWSAAASFIVRAEGASSEAMIGSMIGTVANIVLDPVFISGLGMGGGRGCDCDNDRQYSGKHLLSLVFHEKE